MNIQEEFLKDLEIKDNSNVLDKPIEESESVTPEETAEQAEMKLKNRRERRLAEKWQKEREANIDLNARLQTISESQNIRAGAEEADYLKRVEKIYGNATPEAKEATELLKEALKGLEATATQKALEKFEESRKSEATAIRKEEQTLDEIGDHVEEEYGIDMSNDTDRKGYFNLLEKLSPKDQEGNIIEYADADATAELYLSRKERANVRAKELASRSMVRGGQSQGSKIEEDSTVRFLKENGII